MRRRSEEELGGGEALDKLHGSAAKRTSPQRVNGQRGRGGVCCWLPTESAPSLRFLQGWAAMLPAQLLSVLHRPLCMPSSYPPFSPTRRTGHPHLLISPALAS